MYDHRAGRRLREASVVTVRAQPGEQAFTAAWAEGRATTADQAIAYALLRNQVNTGQSVMLHPKGTRQRSISSSMAQQTLRCGSG